MAECITLRAQFDAAMAAGDIPLASSIWQQMSANNCPDMPENPEDPQGSGGHGNTIPPGG